MRALIRPSLHRSAMGADIEGVGRRGRFAMTVGLAALAIVAGACEPEQSGLSGPRRPSVEITQVETGAGVAAEQGSLVEAHYVGRLPDGSVFIDTRKQGEPHRWIVGEGAIIAGMDEAVMGMRPGGVRMARVPPELHWGRAGYADVVPENATLTFRIEMLSVQ